MIWGAIIGSIIGLIYYVFRLGGVVFIKDIQEAGLGRPQIILVQAVLHAITPAALGAFIGWLAAALV